MTCSGNLEVILFGVEPVACANGRTRLVGVETRRPLEVPDPELLFELDGLQVLVPSAASGPLRWVDVFFLPTRASERC